MNQLLNETWQRLRTAEPEDRQAIVCDALERGVSIEEIRDMLDMLENQQPRSLLDWFLNLWRSR